MKKVLNLLFVFLLLFPLFLPLHKASAVSSVPAAGDAVLSKYRDDAFCFSFENESDYSDENLPIATNYENRAIEKRYAPGAGGSSAALHIRTESSATINGIVNNGVKNLRLVPGKTYLLSAWVKLLCNEIYKVAPNFNFFIMNAGTALYEDESCTIPVDTVSGSYNLIKITGAEIGFQQEDGTISGDWKRAETTFTMPNKLGKYYVDKNAPVSCSMFLRVGSNEHSIKTLSDYTEEFLASITDTSGILDENAFFSDYAIDDWTLEPYVEKAGIAKENRIYNDFENNSWSTSSNIRWTHTSSSAQLEALNEAAQIPNSSNALSLSYTGSPNGYMELSVHLDETASIIHNRAYKISFWAKASPALVNYFNDKNDYFKLIPERTSENRLERTKNKWAETLIKKKFSENFEYFEIIWYEPNDHMLGRDTENDTSVRLDFRIANLPSANAAQTVTLDGEENSCVYTYQNPSGDTVYAGFEDFKVCFDNLTIEPLEIICNGNMDISSPQDITSLSTWDTTCFLPGENTLIQNIFGAGTIVSDPSFSAETGMDHKNVLKMQKTDERPSQNVEVLNHIYYKISFWAKADASGSVNTGISPVFDRSITGPERDAAVTENNPEGRLGYGNLTGAIEDIPYYMYRGPQYTHEFSALEIKSGETLVYDDYFARMKSVDGYENQTEPSAWNYQFYDGVRWISSNRDQVPQIQDNFRLTEKWKQFECYYRWDYEGGHYRLPRFEIASDAPADFSVADIKIERLNKLEDEIKIENVCCGNTAGNLYAGNSLNISYDFASEGGSVIEGPSVLKLLSSDEEGNYAVADMVYCQGSEQNLISIPDLLIGKRPGIEMIPFGQDGTAGAKYRREFHQIVAGKVVTRLAIHNANAAWSITSIFAPNINLQSVNAYLAFYGSDNQLLKTEYINIDTNTYETALQGTVPLDSSVKIKLFVFESTQNLKPCCDIETVYDYPANQTPFSHTGELTAVFFGGSPMCGEGLYNPDETSYRAHVSAYLQDKFVDKNIRIIDASKDGDTTKEALSRIDSDVLVHDPDLVFIDFAADDKGKDVRKELREMILRLCSKEKIPYIIFLYSARSSHTGSAKYYKQVSEEFSIPQIDLYDALRTHLNGGDALLEGYLFDEIHPSAEGHILYANTIIQALDSGKYYHVPKIN